MLKIDLTNLNTIYQQNPDHSLSSHDLEESKSNFDPLYQLILSRGQGFIELPEDLETVQKIQSFAAEVEGKYKHIVILGIGGSLLGPRCILEALAHYNTNPAKPSVHCLDNIDPFKIAQLEAQIDLTATLFLVQTKSGGTPETIAQYLYFKVKVLATGLQLNKHFVFVTDPDSGYLRYVANVENIPSFAISKNVGGRFSVLTPVGLLPAALMGYNIADILAGSREIVQTHLQQAYQLAFIQYTLLQKGKNINVIMPYSSRLKSFSEWCVQLISESLGKEFDLQGNIMNAGITPLPAVGATDQHSQLQLFAEGPNDKLLIFIKPVDYDIELQIPRAEEDSLKYLQGKSFNQLLDAEFMGVGQALTERNRPNLTINIDRVDEYNLGALFMFFELATAFVGEMLGINTFDQPGVERSKILSRENLKVSN